MSLLSAACGPRYSSLATIRISSGSQVSRDESVGQALVIFSLEANIPHCHNSWLQADTPAASPCSASTPLIAVGVCDPKASPYVECAAGAPLTYSQGQWSRNLLTPRHFEIVFICTEVCNRNLASWRRLQMIATGDTCGTSGCVTHFIAALTPSNSAVKEHTGAFACWT
jgi:hypothetical protein